MPTFNPTDSFPFASYLKTGDYMHIGKKRSATEIAEAGEDEEDLQFK